MVNRGLDGAGSSVQLGPKCRRLVSDCLSSPGLRRAVARNQDQNQSECQHCQVSQQSQPGAARWSREMESISKVPERDRSGSTRVRNVDRRKQVWSLWWMLDGDDGWVEFDASTTRGEPQAIWQAADWHLALSSGPSGWVAQWHAGAALPTGGGVPHTVYDTVQNTPSYLSEFPPPTASCASSKAKSAARLQCKCWDYQGLLSAATQRAGGCSRWMHRTTGATYCCKYGSIPSETR